jgi:hypothetical protein
VLVTAIAYAPVVLAQLLLTRGLLLSGSRILSGTAPGWSILGAAIVGVFGYAVMSAVLVRFSSDVYLERATGLNSAVRAVLPVVPRLIGAAILFWLVLTLAFIPVVIGAVTSIIPLVVVGGLLSMAWPFYAIARFFAVFQVIVLEDRGLFAAFSRSSVLSQNRKGHILLTLLLVVILFVMLSFAVTLVAQLFGTIAGSVIIQSLYTVVAYPLIGITQMILYYDTRIRAEGFDIEVMTGALGSPTTTAAS